MSDTPLMQQYHEIRAKYADCVLFFRVGDFYEMFGDQARDVSSLLNLTLTHKGDDPMCGIPFHAARNYIRRLLDFGRKIAVCEQLSLPDNPRVLARRDVVRVITPATVVDEDFLDEKSFNYILCVFRQSCAFCDVSTGDFHIRDTGIRDRIQYIRGLIEQIAPREILVCEDEYFMDSSFREAIDFSNAMVTKLAPWYFNVRNCYKMLCEQAGVKSLASYGLDEKDKRLSPAGAMVRYIRETSKSSVSHLTDFKVDDDGLYLAMDESSRRNLELFSSLAEKGNSLFETINRCTTPAGVRLLKNWLAFPLRDVQAIRFRQDHIQDFLDNPEELSRVRETVSGSGDLNRLTTRVLLRRAVPHDLVSIKQALGAFFSLLGGNPEKYGSLLETCLDNDNLSKCADLMQELENAVNPDFLGQFNAGEVILEGFDEILDTKRNIKDNSDSILHDYIETLKAQTGLTIVKLGYNKVFGYYLELPKAQSAKAPDFFLRKQTLVNGERYTTAELQGFEQQLIVAAKEAEEREREVFESLMVHVQSLMPELNAIGHFLSMLDAFQGLATLASENNYCRPDVTEDDLLDICGGRHPVVERSLARGSFVSNGLSMDTAQSRFCLITGPNMAGKSTYLRQNALIILLAHMGSFVPATSARIGVTDRLFCRVGAMDNLAKGESTFMVEMQETAFILRNCSRSSFVIVDEIGRGTSTQDGMSLAYAIMENLKKTGPRTLFATHYHELTMLDNRDITLLTLEVLEENGSVTFLRRVKEGVANSSYGIHVARLAGLPASVIKQAKSFQGRHFEDYGNSTQQGVLFTSEESEAADVTDIEPYKRLVQELKETDPDGLTPMQALILLSKLKEEASSIEQQ